MKHSISNFVDLSTDEAYNVNGGLLAGALAGGILGGCAGLIVGTVAVCSGASNPGNVIWKSYVSFALSGAAIGAYTPV